MKIVPGCIKYRCSNKKYSGQIISPDNKQFPVEIKGGKGAFNSKDLPNGIYILKVVDEANNPVSSVRFVKH